MGGDKRGGSGGRGGPNKKQKYVHKGQNTKNTGGGIPKGEKGFIITCDGGQERTAGAEAVRLLTEHWEKLHPKAKTGVLEAKEEKASAADGLKAELEELQASKPSDNPFFWIKTNIFGVIFVKMKVENDAAMGPVELLNHVLEDLSQNKELKTRYCIRFIPVQNSCYASLEDVEAMTKPMCLKEFPEATPFKVAVAFDARAHSGECKDRMKVINSVVGHIPQPPHKVDLTKPDKTVLVQIIKSVAAVSIVDTYQKFYKFNIRSIVSPPEKQQQPQSQEAKPDADAVEPSTAEKTDAVEPSPAEKTEASTVADGSVVA